MTIDIKKSWTEVLVYHPVETAEAVANFLFESGATALYQEKWPEEPGQWFSQAGFGPAEPAPELKAELLRFLGELTSIFNLPAQPQAEWRTVPAGEWTEKWKEGLTPLEIGERLVVKPTWCDYESHPGQLVLEIDPGMAFGTGRHATTFMCLQALESLLRQEPVGPWRILDVGSGSGILALACAAFGYTDITAIDNDPEVMPVAAENLAVNRLADRVRLICAEPAALRGDYDLILANLTAGVLINVAPELDRLADPRHAKLILSGILEDQADEVIEAYTRLNFTPAERMGDGEWSTLVLTRGGETQEAR